MRNRRRRHRTYSNKRILLTTVIAAGTLILAAFVVLYYIRKPDTDINLGAFEEDSVQQSGSVNRLADGLRPSPTPTPDPKSANKPASGTASSASSKTSDGKSGSTSDGADAADAPSTLVAGVKFPLREKFIDPVDASYNWCDSGACLEELSARMSGKYSDSTVLWFDSDTVEFSHQGVGMNGIRLYRDDINYKIAMNVPLTGSATSEQNAEVLKAMLCIFSSTPEELYEAIFDSYTSKVTHGINTEKYTIIGDAKIRVKTTDGKVTYLIHSKGDSVRKYTIVLDPGHGGIYSGAVYNGLTEKKVVLSLAKKISDYLTENYENVKVQMTRKKDAELSADIVEDLDLRAAFAQEKNADALISLHLNASEPHTLHGATVYVTNRDALHEEAAELGQCILNRLIGLGLADCGVLTRNSNDMIDERGLPYDYYGVIRHCSERGIIGIIVEHCFMDNDTDLPYINSEEALDAMAQADAIGIAEYLGLD